MRYKNTKNELIGMRELEPNNQIKETHVQLQHKLVILVKKFQSVMHSQVLITCYNLLGLQFCQEDCHSSLVVVLFDRQ